MEIANKRKHVHRLIGAPAVQRDGIGVAKDFLSSDIPLPIATVVTDHFSTTFRDFGLTIPRGLQKLGKWKSGRLQRKGFHYLCLPHSTAKGNTWH